MSVPMDIIEIKISDNETIILDRSKLVFNEANLSEFQEHLALNYDYYGHKLAYLEMVESDLKYELERIWSRLYLDCKEGPEKMSEEQMKSHVRLNPDYASKASELSKATNNKKALQTHLRAWDRAHDNAANRGHTLRKEMDKLNFMSKELEAQSIVGGA